METQIAAKSYGKSVSEIEVIARSARFFSVLAVIVLLLFGINYLFRGEILLGTVESGLGLVLLLNLVNMQRGLQPLHTGVRVLLLIVYFMSYVIFVKGGLGNTGYLWIMFMPLFSTLLTDERESRLWLTTYTAGLLVIVSAHFAGLLALKYSHIEIRQVFIVYFIMLVLNYYHDHIRRDARREIEEKSKELERQARTDHLTGLANRLYLNDFLDHEIYRSERYGDPLSLVLLDLDNFKEVNDTYGHASGDTVLQAVAELIRQHSRLSDLPGRWGGEEFLIVCPAVTLAGATEFAESLRRQIACCTDTPTPITGSFGVVQYKSGHSRDELLSLVDEQLYQAKHEGRNRVCNG